MRRIITTIASVVTIAVLLYWMFNLIFADVPWMFNLIFVVVILFVIIGFVRSIIKTWIRG